ncbi:transcription initiation factor TFIID subunit 4b isoform X2 [Zea mays]|uniref:transcription initiation factor TFIID subunit 4b isoform X2 n=1 Tax=Zea mays TaxID=4577 RepID=UPI00022074B1|nr:uncharacterized protein LOC100384748 isoform X2 [Zea mays]|eukprot:XP_020405551.1 uncharacterized protein LOC100384748 isoform X2 [Zea mays]
MSKAPDDHLQATEQEGSVHSSQQAGQQHVNTADQFSKTELTEGSKIEQPVQVEQQSSHLQQAYPEIQLQQAETDSFQLAEKETGYFGQQSSAGAKVDVAQPSVVQQNAKQTVGQQASSGTQDTKKGPSIPFNMLIPILQAHLDRDKDMQLQTVWAKLRRNEVNKDDFLRVIRNIVGDQMLKQAAHKVFVQMQAQAQRNSQANSSQQSLFSQLSAQQMASSGSAQLHDQKIRPPGPPNQGQKNQVSSSPQAFAPPSGTQPQNSVHYLAHDNPNQNPDAKGTNVVPNQPSRMNTSVPLQTKNKQHQPTQLQQASQQIYGASNPGAQAYPRSITGSLRSPSLVPETQPSMHAPGMAPAKMVPPPTHPMMQHNATAWQMHQNRELKTNAPPPNANMKQNSESVGKVRMAGTGNSSAKGKQGTPNSTPNASGGTKSSKKSGGQKKSLEAAGSMQPSSKKQKTSGGSQEQSIDELNDVTAASGVNIRADGSGATELEKEKEESRPKNVKPNKEEDDKMRANAANVAARQAVGGSDMLSKWQLMAEQARQKREGIDVSAASQPGRGPGSRQLSKFGKGPGEHPEGSKRSHSMAFGTGGMKRPGRTAFAGPQRLISVKDVICALEREPQMTKSRLIYRLHERLPVDSTVD